MRLFKFLSALAVLNLLAVSVISNIPSPKATNTPEISQIVITPTPQIIVKKVITKVYRTIKPVASQQAKSASTTNSNPNPGSPAQVPAANNPPQANPTSPPPPPVAQNRCTITIDGVSYDVTDFRNTHSGGNIFTCGGDMSATFWSRHNAAILSRMQQYKI